MEWLDPMPFVQYDGGDVENEPISQGSIPNADGTDEEHEGEDDEALILVLELMGKLDIGKSGLIFSVFASAFSWRRHLARRF